MDCGAQDDAMEGDGSVITNKIEITLAPFVLSACPCKQGTDTVLFASATFHSRARLWRRGKFKVRRRERLKARRPGG